MTEIREPGTGLPDRSVVQPFAAPAPVAMAARSSGELPAPTIDVDPGEVEVWGSVEITFALEN